MKMKQLHDMRFSVAFNPRRPMICKKMRNDNIIIIICEVKRRENRGQPR